MLALMARRQRAILAGAIGHDQLLIAAFNQADNKMECHYAAHGQAQADRSDPFVYNRVRSHLDNGVTLSTDYHVEWDKERRESQFSPGVEINVRVPKKRKLP